MQLLTSSTIKCCFIACSPRMECHLLYSVYRWFSSYLTDRTQSVCQSNLVTTYQSNLFATYTATPRSVLYGVLQGSVLGPVQTNSRSIHPNRSSFGAAHRTKLIPTKSFDLGCSIIQPSKSIRDLGVYVDSDMSMTNHISPLVSSCFHQADPTKSTNICGCTVREQLCHFTN